MTGRSATRPRSRSSTDRGPLPLAVGQRRFHIEVDLNGLSWCCRAFGRDMLKRERGPVVDVGSMSGFIVDKPQPQWF